MFLQVDKDPVERLNLIHGAANTADRTHRIGVDGGERPEPPLLS